MGKRLTSKSNFAKIAGVTPAAVTKASKGLLQAAMVGDHIDLDHEIAVAYVNNHQKDGPPPLVKGIDPIYEKAIEYCQENNRWSVEGLRKEFGIGYKRGKAIYDTMKANKVIKKKPLKEKSPKKQHVRGTAAAKKTKERASLENLNRQIAQEDRENGVHDQIIEIPVEIEPFVDMSLRELIEQFGTVLAFNEWLNAVKKIEDINEKRIKNAKLEGELVFRHSIQVGIIDPVESTHIQLLKDGSKTIAHRVKTMFEAGSEVIEIEEYIRKHISTFIKSLKGKVARAFKNV